jgi:hypothetical protein
MALEVLGRLWIEFFLIMERVSHLINVKTMCWSLIIRQSNMKIQ